MIEPLVILLFGTIICLLSPVLICVVKIDISSTTPEIPAASIKSPFLNGRKTIIITPAARLDNEP